MHDDRAWLDMLAGLTDDALARTTEDYVWLAEFGPETERRTFELCHDSVVAECERRGRADLVLTARQKWAVPAGRQINEAMESPEK